MLPMNRGPHWSGLSLSVRRWWIVLMALGLAVVILTMTASAQAATTFPPLAKGYCNPEDTYNWRPDCQPIILRRLPVATPEPSSLSPLSQVLTLTYAYVLTGPTALYAHPADPELGVAPLRTLEQGYVWVRLMEQVVYRNTAWYLTDGGGYLLASKVAIYEPSSFQGAVVLEWPSVPFAWVLQYVQTSPQPGTRPDAKSRQFKRYDMVNLYEQTVVNGQVWYRVGRGEWLVQTAVAKVEWRSPPPEVGPGEKRIDIDLFEQTLAAYEGDRMVYATLISSGLPQWATVKGIFRIHSKYTFGLMDGQEGKPDFYSLEDVPWSMYFYQDYALHGAYWHDGFGWRHSHGCVNLAPLDAKWLYDWTTPVVPQGWAAKRATQAEPGTWMWVHD